MMGARLVALQQPRIRSSGACSTSSRRWRSPRACACRRSTSWTARRRSTPSPPAGDVSGAVGRVTRGTLERLTRDELQGVIGHEFSHILNGDMRLNIRMIGVLAGIVAHRLGRRLRHAQRVRGRRHARRDRRSSSSAWRSSSSAIPGLFFARLIKAAVSRQREFLADASSVQFTRNPDGIAGALDQIRASGAGTLIQARYAEEMSHMFFGQSVKMRLAGLFADAPAPRGAHPRACIPASSRRRTAGVALPSRRRPSAGRKPPGSRREATAVPAAGRRRADNGTAWGRSAGESAQLVGALAARENRHRGPPARRAAGGPARVRAGGRWRARGDRLPALRAAGGSQARAARGDEARRSRLARHRRRRRARRSPAASAVGFHLPVIDLALPAVKAAPEMAKKELLAGIEAVINADRRVSLHEFVVLSLVRHQLAAPAKPPAARARLAELEAEAAVDPAPSSRTPARARTPAERAAKRCAWR